VQAGAAITALNSAARPLSFDAAGAEVGTDTYVTTSWYTEKEWKNDTPEKINLVSKMKMPITGVIDSTLTGTTWIGPSTPGDITCDDCAAEVPPAVSTHDPGALKLLDISRSSSIGAMPTGEGSSHEGLNIAFLGVACGLYSTEYTVVIEPDAKSLANGAKAREATWTSFESTQSRDIDQVFNGTTGRVVISAECPASVPTDPIAPVNASYTQTMPQPIMTAANNAAAPHQHQIKWTPVSSLATFYFVESNVENAGFAPTPATTNPTSGTALAAAWPVGSTYGQAYEYRVVAEANSTGIRSPYSARVPDLVTPWPAVPQPSMNGVDTGALQYTVTVNNIPCPVGTAAMFNQRANMNLTGWETYSPFVAKASTIRYDFIEGRRGDFQGQARCTYTDPTSGLQRNSPTSAANIGLDNNTPEYWVEPITTAPRTPDRNVTDNVTPGTPVTVTHTAAGCPTETVPEYRLRYGVNGGAVGGWSAWTKSTTETAAMDFGARLGYEVEARCVSPWAVGPTTGAPVTNWDRPIPAPAWNHTPWSDAGGVSAPKSDRVVWNAVACWPGTTTQYAAEHIGYGLAGWQGATTHNVGVAWGTTYNYQIFAKCVSNYVESPAAVSPNTAWTTNVPTPAQPSLNLPASASTGQTYTASINGSTCPAGTSTGYYARNSRDGTTWGQQAWNDSWGRISNSAATWNVTYTAVVYCIGPNARGADSPAVSDTIRINQPDIPAPAAPSGLTSGAALTVFCDGGFSVRLDWNAPAGATSYRVDYSYRGSDNVMKSVSVTTGSSSLNVVQGDSARSVGFTYSVRSIGPGGTSAPASSSVGQIGGCSG
jgi:hypothetical protein